MSVAPSSMLSVCAAPPPPARGVLLLLGAAERAPGTLLRILPLQRRFRCVWVWGGSGSRDQAVSLGKANLTRPLRLIKALRERRYSGSLGHSIHTHTHTTHHTRSGLSHHQAGGAHSRGPATPVYAKKENRGRGTRRGHASCAVTRPPRQPPLLLLLPPQPSAAATKPCVRAGRCTRAAGTAARDAPATRRQTGTRLETWPQ